MESERKNAQDAVQLEVPVKIDYQVLNAYLKASFSGKILSKGQSDGTSKDQARILECDLGRSELEAYDLRLLVRLELLSFPLRGKQVEVAIDLSLHFDLPSQELLVNSYEIEGRNNGWLTDQAVELLLNTIFYSRLKNKMKFDLQPLLEKQLHKFNTLLQEAVEVKSGIWLTGHWRNLEVLQVLPGHNHLLVNIRLEGRNQLEIRKLEFSGRKPFG